MRPHLIETKHVENRAFGGKANPEKDRLSVSRSRPDEAGQVFLNPGTYTISGAGGTTLPLGPLGVPPFSQDVTIPAPLIWTNRFSPPAASCCKVCLLTKVAALPGECEKVDAPSLWRAVAGTGDAKCAHLESGTFPHYWPFRRGFAVPPSTGMRRALEADKFGSSGRTRTYDLSVNTAASARPPTSVREFLNRLQILKRCDSGERVPDSSQARAQSLDSGFARFVAAPS
jgi:hypothetical protein